MARVRKAGSSLAAYLPRMPLMDSASMRAWAGSYTPQGRSQCAETTVVGVIRRRSESMRVASFPTDGADDQILRPYPRGSGRCMGRTDDARLAVGTRPRQRLVDGAGPAGRRHAAGPVRIPGTPC